MTKNIHVCSLLPHTNQQSSGQCFCACGRISVVASPLFIRPPDASYHGNGDFSGRTKLTKTMPIGGSLGAAAGGETVQAVS